MKTILHTVDIQVPLDKVFQALATESGLAGWWTTKVKADIRKEGQIHFTFIPSFNPVMEITALEPPRRMAWKCVGGHEAWSDNTFSFEIEPRDTGCILFFRQEYSRELSDEEYGRYNFNWGYYLDSLQLLVEEGKGKPYSQMTPGS